MQILMRILVIGSGGREHALVWKLAQSPLISHLWCAPGNPGMAEEVLSFNGRKVFCVPIPATDILALRDFAKKNEIDLTVVGPEKPLALGITDLFEVAGLTIFGPNKMAARFEASKCFAQKFAQRHGLPFAPGECFYDPDNAKAYAYSLSGRCVVKADGFCDGKGAFLCQTVGEAKEAIENLLLKRELGPAGYRIVIQELLEGFELSLHILCDGKAWKLLPASQDHKRLRNGNQGPLTGGMGSYSPHSLLSLDEIEKVADAVMVPFLEGCKKEAIVFRGLLYPGIMMTKNGPKILEFNCRFGDPETQVIVPRIKTDLAELLFATAKEKLDKASFEICKNWAICVVIATPGYPENPVLGKKIMGLEELKSIPGLKIFHAGTKLQGSDLVTSGGRVLGVTAWNTNIGIARWSVYHTASKIQINGGKPMRSDIGTELISSFPVVRYKS
ncbi:MAG: phosphoribosylamine--glycine ligase [bacterium]|nr:phosphoribosylamine--glycine ligase [bacterium]